MAKIFFSMAGQGRGHATRVQALVERLQDDHEIALFAPADAHDLLAPSFRATRVRVERIPGLLFRHRPSGGLDFGRTLLHGARYVAGLRRLVRRLEETLRRECPDLVITDFEPALPRAAERSGIPYISVDHQHFLIAYDLSSLPAPLRRHAALMGLVVRAYYRRQQATIISSFYFPPLRRGHEDVVQVGVLLRKRVLEMESGEGDHVVAYLQRYVPENVLEALEHAGCEVRVYGLGERPSRRNIRFLAVDPDRFLADLATSRALVSTAGNQLVGEALYLEKPVLALPGKGNHEQFINAHFLRLSGGGDWVRIDRLDGRKVPAFLERVDEFRSSIDRESLNGTEPAVRAILSRVPSPALRSGEPPAARPRSETAP